MCAAVAGLQETYLATMDAVDRVAPGTALFILQGPQQQAPAGYSQAQWGSGFSTEPGLLRLGSPGGGMHEFGSCRGQSFYSLATKVMMSKESKSGCQHLGNSVCMAKGGGVHAWCDGPSASGTGWLQTSPVGQWLLDRTRAAAAGLIRWGQARCNIYCPSGVTNLVAATMMG